MFSLDYRGLEASPVASKPFIGHMNNNILFQENIFELNSWPSKTLIWSRGGGGGGGGAGSGLNKKLCGRVRKKILFKRIYKKKLWIQVQIS
jgi:hypothetical protein